MNNLPEYQAVDNRPIGCSFCGAQVQGRILDTIDPQTKEPTKECRWICGRCGNLVKVGKLR
jgi:hypothetical protein